MKRLGWHGLGSRGVAPLLGTFVLAIFLLLAAGLLYYRDAILESYFTIPKPAVSVPALGPPEARLPTPPPLTEIRAPALPVPTAIVSQPPPVLAPSSPPTSTAVVMAPASVPATIPAPVSRPPPVPDTTPTLNPSEKAMTLVEPRVVEVKVVAPPPLRVDTSVPATANLTAAGIINWTNFEREQRGLPPLKENQKLNTAAFLKVDDMFARQYFEHVSPTGEGPADLAGKAGYVFILVGENLALGNTFRSDHDLVTGWMNSPGHRENILKSTYQEIGVAVKKGIHQGVEVWLGVQEFGTAKSACAEPDVALKQRVDSDKEQLVALSAKVDQKQNELDQIDPRQQPKEYNQKVDQFNTLINQYNQRLTDHKADVALYNKQVNEFNACVAEFVR